MHKRQRGFAVLEAIFLVVIVAAFAGIGWYVWRTNKNASSTLSYADAVNRGDSPKVGPVATYKDCLKFRTSTQDEKAFPRTCTTKAGKKFADPDPAADWKEYVSKDGKYSLKYPSKWQADVCDPQATDLVLYLGPTKASSVICNSEHGSQIMVVSTPAVPTASEQILDDEYFDQKSSKKVVVDGVTGMRQSGRLKVDEAVFAPLGAGTIVVNYFFLPPGRSYILSYVQAPSGDYAPDNLAVFDYLAQKTLSFTD